MKMSVEEIRGSKQYQEAKVVIKRHGGFNLVGKYKLSDATIEEYLKESILHHEIYLQAMKDMLSERDFH